MNKIIVNLMVMATCLLGLQGAPASASNITSGDGDVKKVASRSVSSTSSIININTATVEELSTLKGIGMKKAQAIITYRELNGNFKVKEELSNVKGIGNKMVNKVIDQIEVK